MTKGILQIPLQDRVLASELGQLLSGLADLYSVAHVAGKDVGAERERLVAKRISVGTPNVAELVGLLPHIVTIAAALVAILKVPKAFAEGFKDIADARKTWIEGTLLKRYLSKAELAQLPDQDEESIAYSFSSLARSRDVISAEPRVLIEGSEHFKAEKVVARHGAT